MVDVKCPKCSGPMVLRNGSRGSFWGCQRYPACDGSQETKDVSAQAVVNESKVVIQGTPPDDMPIGDVLRLALGELRARRSVLDDFRRLKIEDLPSGVDYVGRQLERIGNALEEILIVVNAATVNFPVRSET